MAHFAKLDDNNKVIDIMVISDDQIMNENGVEDEQVGIARCKEIAGAHTNWRQCSFNYNMRGTYPIIQESYYIEENDIFTPPKPFESWIWNTTEQEWKSPKPKPEDTNEGGYTWDEDSLDWVFRPNPTILNNIPVRPEPPDSQHDYILDFSTGEPTWKLIELPPPSTDTI